MKLHPRAIFIFLVLLTGTGIIAQTHTLEGRAVNMAWQPLSGALIQFPDIHRTTTCDDSGRFVMRNLPGSSQVVIVSRVGYHTSISKIALNDSIIHMDFMLAAGNNEEEEVIIFGSQSESENASSTTIAAFSQRGMRSNGALSISDAISKLPGVSQLSTGAGISKPVIRGLYGNRIETVLMGMRFDNQQWQDEHGLGLNDIGVGRVEVIKGPAALMYGSEAMGGVVNVIEEQPADVDSVRADFSTKFFSNTFGGGIDAGVRATRAHYFYRLRIGMESQADYSDGNNKRILNSRFDGYCAKGTFGFDKKNWVCVNNYMFSKSDFGFIMDTSSYLAPDARISRRFANPHHTVYINMFTTQNSFFAANGDVSRLNVGVHINRRMEDEGGSGISLDMQLITLALDAQREHVINRHWTTIGGVDGQYQNNTNFGARVIVPDASLAEISVFDFNKFSWERTHIDLGIRYDMKNIITDSLPQFQIPPPAFLHLVDRTYQTVNASAGGSFELAEDFFFRANITTGYRAPNLAELESNGVHEGTLHYEIGDPDMKIEQDFSAEGGLSYDSKRMEITATVFDNRFLNYIYVTPTADTFYGFHVYRFIQTNATMTGGEFTVDIFPLKSGLIDLSASYSHIRAVTDQGNYLPFIPADKLDGDLKFELGDKGKWNDLYFRVGGTYVFDQDRPGQFESVTPAYALLDAGFGSTIKLNGGKRIDLDICGNNLLNEKYYDHLSRFKEYKIYNIGRNISLNFKYEW